MFVSVGNWEGAGIGRSVISERIGMARWEEEEALSSRRDQTNCLFINPHDFTATSFPVSLKHWH